MGKYVISWENQEGAAGQEDLGRRLMDVYSKWTPAAGNILQFLSRVDGQGGLSIVETDNVLEIMRDTAKFSTWLKFTVTPVVDIQDAVPVFNEALDFLDSVPK